MDDELILAALWLIVCILAGVAWLIARIFRRKK